MQNAQAATSLTITAVSLWANTAMEQWHGNTEDKTLKQIIRETAPQINIDTVYYGIVNDLIYHCDL